MLQPKWPKGQPRDRLLSALPKNTIYKRKGRTQPTGPAPELATKKRANTLANLFMAMGTFKPAGILTTKMCEDWKATCTRVATNKVARAERATIDKSRPHMAGAQGFLGRQGRELPTNFRGS